MTRKKQIKSNIIGLDMGLAVGRFFLNTEDLHYGYWPDNEKPTTVVDELDTMNPFSSASPPLAEIISAPSTSN